MERRLCPTCGSLNPIASNSCLTCEGTLQMGASGLVNIASLLPQRHQMPTSRSVWQNPQQPELTRTASASHLGDCRACHNAVSRDMRFCQWCGVNDPFRPTTFKYQNKFHSTQDDYEAVEEKDYVCKVCLTENLPSSRFCCRCGGDIIQTQRSRASSILLSRKNRYWFLVAD